MDMKANNRERVTVSAPLLGEHVELVEATVGEVLALQDKQSAPGHKDEDLLWDVLALSLVVDGETFTPDELRQLGARRMRLLTKLAMQAMGLNGFTGEEKDEDGNPKG